MNLSFYKTGELNGSFYVKIPSRSSANLNFQNNENFCYIWSILASIHPCENTHPSKVKKVFTIF